MAVSDLNAWRAGRVEGVGAEQWDPVGILRGRWTTGGRVERKRTGSTLTWELPLWVALAYWSMLPSVITPWWQVSGVPISSKDLLVILLASFYAPALLLRRRRWGRRTPGARLPFLVALITAYASFSLLWSDASSLDAVAMAYTLLLTVCAFIVGRAIVVLHHPEAVGTLLWRILVALGVIALIYSAESLVSLGLRSESAKEWTDFGIQRVRGPLFGSAVGAFVIVPALALAVEEARRGERSKLLAYGLAVVFLVALFGLGSRAGLLTLAVFIALLLFSRSRLRTKVSLALLFGVLLTIAGTVVFSKATANRLMDFSDVSRLDTHVTAWEIVRARPILVSVFGSGYGSIWPWYLPDVEDGGARATGRFLIESGHGRSLYHPHSVFLLMVVELGIVGTIFLVCLLCVLRTLAIKGFRRSPYAIFAFGIAASGVMLFTDLVLVKSWPFSVLWWILLFGGLSLTHDAQRRVQEGALQKGQMLRVPAVVWRR